MTYKLTKIEERQISDIKEKKYMKPVLKKIDDFIKKDKNKNNAVKNVFDNIHDLMRESEESVDKYLSKRSKEGSIKDKGQAKKNLAGQIFPYAIVYIFLKNKEYGNITENIFITSKPSSIKGFDRISNINVDKETQKPDCDLVIYKMKKNEQLDKCMIVSLKTSLRERAGQTYKWKLLMEIATHSKILKSKYKITYNPGKTPTIAFATVNFHNEINKPQQRGMFKFFDKSFIAKNIDADFISRMSTLVEYLKNW